MIWEIYNNLQEQGKRFVFVLLNNLNDNPNFLMIKTFKREHLIIFILEPLYAFELNRKISDIYMNRSAIDEENQVDISGVYHLDPWESFAKARRLEKVRDRTELDKFIKNITESHSNHKKIIAEAIERYAKEENKFIDDKPSFLHIIWAGDLSGNGYHIQLEQLLFHFIQFQLDRFKIRQALFTNFFMFKHNVISRETLEKLYNPKSYELPKSINTRPYNDAIMKQLSDMVIELKQFDVSDLTVSIGDEIENLIFRIAKGKLTSNDLGRIKQEPHHIKYKPSVTKLFHVQKLESEQLKKLDIKNPDKEYVKSF